MSTSEKQSHGDEVFVFLERLTPSEGRMDSILAASRDSLELLKGQPGLIQTIVSQSEKGGKVICSMSVWEKKSDFQAFLKTDAVAKFLASEDYQNVKSWLDDYEMQMMDLVDGWHG